MTQAEITAAVDRFHASKPVQAGSPAGKQSASVVSRGGSFPGQGATLGGLSGDGPASATEPNVDAVKAPAPANTPKKRTLEDELADGAGEGFDDDDEPETEEDEPSRKKR